MDFVGVVLFISGGRGDGSGALIEHDIQNNCAILVVGHRCSQSEKKKFKYLYNNMVKTPDN